jgi:hypothetical protein
MGEHDLSEQIVLKRGGGSLVRSYLKALLEGGSDPNRIQVTGCGASDTSTPTSAPLTGPGAARVEMGTGAMFGA